MEMYILISNRGGVVIEVGIRPISLDCNFIFHLKARAKTTSGLVNTKRDLNIMIEYVDPCSLGKVES